MHVEWARVARALALFLSKYWATTFLLRCDVNVGVCHLNRKKKRDRVIEKKMRCAPSTTRVWYRSTGSATCPICLDPLSIVKDSVVVCVNDVPVSVLRVGASLVFGRNDIKTHNDVVIPVSTVSRNHGILFFQGDRIFVDVNGLNARRARLVNVDTNAPTVHDGAQDSQQTFVLTSYVKNELLVVHALELVPGVVLSCRAYMSACGQEAHDMHVSCLRRHFAAQTDHQLLNNCPLCRRERQDALRSIRPLLY